MAAARLRSCARVESPLKLPVSPAARPGAAQGSIPWRTTSRRGRFRHVAWRFIPFLILCYFVAYLDRVNVGFAKLTMDADLGPLGDGLRLRRGRLLPRLFPVRGALQHHPGQGRRAPLDRAHHAVLGRRFRRDGLHPGNRAGDRHQRRTHVLSAADPARLRRSRVLSRHHLFPDPVVPRRLPGAHRRLFHGGDPALVRARLAGLGCAARPRRRVGFRGWQWLFIVEALPSIVLAVVTFFYLTDRPADASWLDERSRSWLHAAPRRSRTRGASMSRRRARLRASPTRGCWRCRSSISATSPASTASASGCRPSSRASAFRSP